jgi:hypothetical protein
MARSTNLFNAMRPRSRAQITRLDQEGRWLDERSLPELRAFRGRGGARAHVMLDRAWIGYVSCL